tara:strand:- start:172 stop:1422 length:1251 start_codon:yes stop_codon:yes gene_type:complete
MTTQNFSSLNDIIVPTNNEITYRGLEGDDTYILISNSNSNISIVDTEGNNTIQLPEWSKIKSIAFTSDAVRITCDSMAVFTINGADKFNFDIGGNKTNNENGIISTFDEFASFFDLNIPESGQVSFDDDKIVYNDKLAELYTVEVKEEDNGNKFYINGDLSPDLKLSSSKTYVFDQNDLTTNNHPLAISETKNGSHNDGVSVQNIKFFANGYNKSESEYSEIFLNEDSFDNAFVVFTPSVNDTALYYYCLFHSGMANDSSILIDGFEIETITATLNISNNGTSHYVISNKNDPDITLERGKTYEFNIDSPGHPFWIKTNASVGSSNSYSDGVINNGVSSGVIRFEVPLDAPDQLYYSCQIHTQMRGKINIVDINSTGQIISDSTFSSNTGGGYGYGIDLLLVDEPLNESPPIIFDI